LVTLVMNIIHKYFLKKQINKNLQNDHYAHETKEIMTHEF